MANVSDTALLGRLARCEIEIAAAINESHAQHTHAEHLGILLWELDWRSERESILAELDHTEEKN